jgi:hypothetical protein
MSHKKKSKQDNRTEMFHVSDHSRALRRAQCMTLFVSLEPNKKAGMLKNSKDVIKNT